MRHTVIRIRRPATETFVVSAEPFGRATILLREATALVERRPRRHVPLHRRLLKTANRATDEELQRLSRELRIALQALQSAATESGPAGWIRR